MKIMSIKRLMFATKNIGHSTAVMEQQIQRSRDRLNMGVDLSGRSFAPYKENRPSNQSRPLAKASRLWSDARYSMSNTLDGFELTATITGRAAEIATYQNVKRRFVGFSGDDKDLVKRGILAMFKEAMKHGPK
jgi:hypothetical protein